MNTIFEEAYVLDSFLIYSHLEILEEYKLNKWW